MNNYNFQNIRNKIIRLCFFLTNKDNCSKETIFVSNKSLSLVNDDDESKSELTSNFFSRMKLKKFSEAVAAAVVFKLK